MTIRTMTKAIAAIPAPRLSTFVRSAVVLVHGSVSPGSRGPARSGTVLAGSPAPACIRDIRYQPMPQ